MPIQPFRRDDEVEEEREELGEESREVFDRVGFAMSAIDLLRPAKMTVAVCQGRTKVRVEAGRAWGRGEGARWALVSVPPRASREAIALAIASLQGPVDGARRAYVFDVLLSRARDGGVA